MNLSPEFELVHKLVLQTNESVFITGKAGTGKTTLLKQITERSTKKMAIAAPTGVAAMNAGGVTLHALLQLPLQQFVPVARVAPSSGLLDKQSLVSNLRMNRDKLTLLRELETLIIDEISMVRADLLDAADTILRHVRNAPLVPFGGVQMLFFGDMYQLPPVVQDGERQLLSQYYTSQYFFDAKVIAEMQIIGIELRKVYRQKDTRLVNVLNRLRVNEFDQDDYELLKTYLKPNFVPGETDNYIYLTSHNSTADSINQTRLKDLPASERVFVAQVVGDFNETAFPADRYLTLKVGAQVMFIRNDKGENRRYYNGKIGLVTAFEDSKIQITSMEDQSSIWLERDTWENIKYSYNEQTDAIKNDVLGTFSQFPIRLAWAITIHKSQGLTFDKAIIDAGRSFAPGQVYVALSRLTSFDGLVLKSEITPRSLHLDPRLDAVSDIIMRTENVERQLPDLQKKYAKQLIMKAYDYQKIQAIITDWKLLVAAGAVPDLHSANKAYATIFQMFEQFEQVGQKFVVQLELLFEDAFISQSFIAIPERIEKANQWFAPRLTEALSLLDQHIKLYEAKKQVKKYVGLIRAIKKLTDRKRQYLTQIQTLAVSLKEPSVNFDALYQASGTTDEETERTNEKGATKHISLKMFLEGKNIAQIASERGMVYGTIESHLASFIPTGQVQIEQLVPDSLRKQILDAAKQLDTISVTACRTALKNTASYTQIRITLEQMQKTA